MKTRLELHEFLCEILGTRNCYYNPPANIQMKYPCFVYHSEIKNVRHADDIRYLCRDRYSIMLIDKDPESKIAEKLFESDLPYLSEDRSPYVSDGMYHFVYTLYL